MIHLCYYISFTEMQMNWQDANIRGTFVFLTCKLYGFLLNSEIKTINEKELFVLSHGLDVCKSS